jgi:preprotein translocase subunit SecG
MTALVSFVSIVHIVLCVLIVLAVLVQSGKGAEISASFGGSSQTVFGSSGGANFFTTFTGICAACFMVSSVFLATQGGSRYANKSVMDTAVPATTAPANPATAPGAQNGAAANTAPGANTAAAAAATTPAENAVVPAKPGAVGHAPDQATQNAIEPGAANNTATKAAAPAPKH